MAQSTFQNRKERLDRILGLLKSEDHITTEVLAKKLRVSHRTLMRDLEELRTSGIPIESDRGRGGGLRLSSQWGLGRLQLNYKESLDLILSLAVMEKFNSPLLLTQIRSLRDKVFQSFPEEHRKRLQLIRKRVFITKNASAERVASSVSEVAEPIKNTLHEAFFEMKVVKIIYKDETGRTTDRSIEVQYLLLSWPLWYVMVWDRLRNDIRSLRVDRIQKAQLTDESFRLHHQENFIEIFNRFSESL